MGRLFFSRTIILALLLGNLVHGSPFNSTLFKRDIQPAAGPVHITGDRLGEYIRVSRMNDGSLISGYATLEQAGTVNVLKTARSTDEGASWHPLGEVFRGPLDTHDMDNAFPMQLPDGRVLFAYRNHDRTNRGPYDFFRISISVSADGGRRFVYLATVDERVASRRPGMANGLWEPFLRLARDGSIQCYYSAENDDGDQDNLMRSSTDGGHHWSAPVVVSGAGIASRDGMVGVAPLNNEKALIAVFEETDTGHFEVSSVASFDDGMTWCCRSKLYRPHRNGATAGAPQVYNVWGALVVSFLTNDDHDIGQGYAGGDMKVVISKDASATWSRAFITGPSPARWPGLFNLNPGQFMALYSRDGEGALSQVYNLNEFKI